MSKSSDRLKLLKKLILHKVIAELGPGARIPSLRIIAQELGSQKDSVACAMRLLEAEKLVFQPPFKRGYFVPGEKTATYPAKQRDTTVQAAFDRIRQDLLFDRFPAGKSLPAMKALTVRYAVAPSTMRKAVALCIQRGIIKRAGRALTSVHDYASSRVPDRSAAKRGILGINCSNSVSRVHFAGSTAMRNPSRASTHEFLINLERELSRVGWNALGFHLSDDPLHERPDISWVSAYVAIRAEASDRWGEFFNENPRIPLCAFDPNETMDWGPQTFKNHRTFSALCPDNYRAGFETGHYLLSRGHRSVCFFSHIPWPEKPSKLRQTRWLPLRTAGLRDSLGGALHEYWPPEPGSGAPQHSPLSLGLRDYARKVVKNGRTSNGKLAPLSPKLWTYFENQISSFADILDQNVLIYNSFAAAFETDATCWVCVNDTLAAAASAFVDHAAGADPAKGNAHGPGRVNVVSFDNSVLSYLLGISSYDMGLREAGSVAARCITMPQLVKPGEDGFMRLPGRLVVRDG